MSNEVCEKCVKLVNDFIDTVLEGDEKKLLDYCFIKNAYFKEMYYNNIEKDFPKLKEHYSIKNTNDEDVFFENKGGDGDRIKVVLAIYCLLWGNKSINLKCNHSEFNKIEIVDKDNNSYSGDTLNTRDTIFSTYNEKLEKLKENCNDEEKKVLESRAEGFRINYVTIGNFMPMPTENLLNRRRAFDFELKDQFDLYLKEVKKFYKKEDIKHFTSKTFYEILNNNREYFDKFGSFEKFIEDNYLGMYLKNGEVEDLFDRKGNKKVLPESYNELIEYMDNAEKKIEERAKLMLKDLLPLLKR